MVRSLRMGQQRREKFPAARQTRYDASYTSRTSRAPDQLNRDAGQSSLVVTRLVP